MKQSVGANKINVKLKNFVVSKLIIYIYIRIFIN